MSGEHSKAALGALVAVFAAMSYGLNTPLARVAHDNGIDTAISALSRASVLLVVAGAFILITGASFAIPRHRRWAVFMVGLTSALCSVAYFGAVAFISVSLAAIIFFTFPLQILIWSMVRRGLRPGPLRIAAFALAFVGLVLVIGPQWDAIDWRGAALAAIGGLSATGLYFVAARASADCALAPLVFWSHVVIVPSVACVALVSGASSPAIGIAAWWPVIVMSLAYIAAYALQITALRLCGPEDTGLYFNLEPIMTGAVAAAVVGERLAGLQYAGAGLVVGALLAASLSQRRPTRPPLAGAVAAAPASKVAG